MMMYMLLVVVAMAMSAEASERFHVFVDISNPATEHALDKYRCCWGDYHMKLVLQKGMLQWHKIETQPRNSDHYHTSFDTSYYIPMPTANLGPLTGYLLRYTRLQGEKFVSDYKKCGFYGIARMYISPVRVPFNVNIHDHPYCNYKYPGRNNETIPVTQDTVACIYNRPEDKGANEMVKKAFPGATYFDAILMYFGYKPDHNQAPKPVGKPRKMSW